MKVVYKITYPNGKIYVGKDLTNSINYFGSASSPLIAEDFADEERVQFTVTREILWKSDDATDQEVNVMELHYIRLLRANDPKVGYNGWPRAKAASQKALSGLNRRNASTGAWTSDKFRTDFNSGAAA